MKKSLLMLAAGLFLTAGSASADWGIVGEFNGWGSGDIKMTETSSGVWTATVETLEGQFKFRENEGWSNNMGNTTGGILKITKNGEYAAQSGGQNFSFPEKVENVTLTLDLNTKKVTVSGMAGEIVIDPNQQAVIYLRGDMNSWGATDAWKFSTTDGKIYTLKVAELAAGKLFKVADASWGDVNYSSQVAKMELNTPYECAYNVDTNMGVAATVTDATITFDLDTKTITITGEGGDDPNPPTPEQKTFYLRGDMNGWGATDAYKFTTTDNIVYTLSVALLEAGQAFKVADAEWGDINYSSGNMSMDLDTPYQCFYNNSDNMGVASNVENATITYNIDTNYITITGEGGVVVEKKMYILGDINGWNPASGEEMTTVDDHTFTWTGTMEAGKYFCFASKLGTWDDVNANRYAPEAPDTMLEKGYNSVFKNYDTSWKLPEDLDGEITLTIDIEAMTLKADFGTTAVAEVEVAEGEAVYYNLQGVQVANPENGIYVKVLGGKASKVVVK